MQDNEYDLEAITDAIAEAMTDAIKEGFCFGGPNCDMSITDAAAELAYRTKQVANAITPIVACGNTDAAGGHVTSLTEAVVGTTSALVQIAEAIQSLADAVREVGDD